MIKSDLGVYTGRLFYTGTPSRFNKSYMGKNTVSNVPKEVANLLSKEDSSAYTFHSLRRSSATAAADAGASIQQLMDFYGWQSSNLPQEYVSSSKFAIKSMADRLQPSGSSAADNDRLQSTGSSAADNVPHREKKTQVYEKRQMYEKAEKIVVIENFNGTITNFSM